MREEILAGKEAKEAGEGGGGGEESDGKKGDWLGVVLENGYLGVGGDGEGG